MKIKCGNCGKDIIVPDDLVIGQHVRCPYCNEKSAFDKPTRVALPEGFEVKRKARTKIDELKRRHEQTTAAADIPDEEQKPKLAIRRPAQETRDREHMNAAAAAVHERIRKAERRRRILNFKKSFGNLISLVGLAVLAIVGYFVWKAVQKKEVPRPVAEIVEYVVEKVVPKQDDAEELRRKEKEAQERRRIEEETAKRSRQAEIEKMDAVRKQNAEAYEQIAATFRAGQLAMANHRKIAEALGQSTNVFYFCLADEEAPVYEVSSPNNGARRVVKRSADGTAAEENLDTFASRLESCDYLMAHRQRVYFRTTRKNPMTGRLSVRESTDPTERFFGKLYGTVRKLGLDCEALAFDIVFQPRDSKQEVAVRTVGFGCGYAPDEVRGAVAEAFPMKGVKDSMKIKKFKRTVVFWDGNMVKNGIDGIMYVPRTYQHHGTTAHYYGSGWKTHGNHDAVQRDRKRWEELSRQAKCEELEERQYYEREQRRVDEELAKANAAALERWKKSIDDMLENGTLTYRAKIAKEEK